MPTIEFEGSGLASDKLTEEPDGGDLLDICDKILAPIPFSCRSASCGTCHIEVVKGIELLTAAGEEEADLLDLLDGPPNSRLACQAKVKPGPGYVLIRPVRA
jgi:ferredoxin